LEKEYKDELAENPYLFIKGMIYMNKFFEKNKIKTFNVFPSRSSVIPKHVTLDAASISVVFCNNKYSSIEEYKKEIYQKIFNFPDSYFSLNNKYIFTGTIQTDGVSLSLLYTLNENYKKKLEIEEKKHTAKNKKFILKREIKSYMDKIKDLSKDSKKNKKEINSLNKKIKKIEDEI